MYPSDYPSFAWVRVITRFIHKVCFYVLLASITKFTFLIRYKIAVHHNVFKPHKITNLYKSRTVYSNLSQTQKRYNFYSKTIVVRARARRFFLKRNIINTKPLPVKVLSLRFFTSLDQKKQIKKDFVRDMPLQKQYLTGPGKKHKIIRPLLDLKRESITTVCKNFNLPVYPDKSNRSVRYSRNRIRKQIIPSIKRFLNPQVENSLFKTAELFNQEQKFLYSLLTNTEIN